MAEDKIKVNRAPVLTLWAAVVAERLGYEPDEALTLGRGVAGLNAQSKGRRLGIYEEPTEESEKKAREAEPPETTYVEVLNRSVPVVRTEKGLRATAEGKAMHPQSVERYLQGKFKDSLEEVRAAMHELAWSYEPDELEKKAYSLYEKFRPEVPEGTRGWGAMGYLDLRKVRSLEKQEKA